MRSQTAARYLSIDFFRDLLINHIYFRQNVLVTVKHSQFPLKVHPCADLQSFGDAKLQADDQISISGFYAAKRTTKLAI